MDFEVAERPKGLGKKGRQPGTDWDAILELIRKGQTVRVAVEREEVFNIRQRLTTYIKRHQLADQVGTLYKDGYLYVGPK